MHHPPGVAMSPVPASSPAAMVWPVLVASAGGSGGNARERSSREACCPALPPALPSGDEPLPVGERLRELQ
eukprot:3940554-Heterocapsa_arctica.AAC.1